MVLSIHGTNIFANKNFGISSQTIELANKILEKHTTVFNLFANPYAIDLFSNTNKADAIVVSYEDVHVFRDVSAQMLFGAYHNKGRLPVSVHSYETGAGLASFNRERLRYGFPEQMGIDSLQFSILDTIVNQAIKLGAMPGAQVLVAKNRNIIYNKAFGYQTYLKKKPTSLDDIYDLASITKIAGTLPLIMKLYDEGQLSLNDNLGKLLPFLDTTNKAGITLAEVLTHQAGLMAWMPFYMNTLEGLLPELEMFNRDLSPSYPLQLDKGALW
ncbi:MAG: beta-lactamase family protein [Bacteroidales bacterium]|nr:beta-lactamase family protein [Bacteroidales bacterium]